jgi:hypothetical protein
MDRFVFGATRLNEYYLQLRRLLAGCEVVEFDEASAHAAGRLLGWSKTNDIVDAAVVERAIRRHGAVVTGDIHDLSRLASAAGARLRILEI